MNHERFPEVHDLVAVNIKGVDYYGYICDIDYDLRSPSVGVEFFPGGIAYTRFDFTDIQMVDFPKPIELKK